MNISQCTKREKEILALLAEGRTSAYIAKQLNLSVHTVNTAISNLTFKMNARNRAHLVAKLYQWLQGA